jgi:Fur family ferric uptake transcriptional regulator
MNKRLTEQRRVILEELSKVRSHPTAAEIYEMVRKRLPKISLGTVYRNLELLAESGRINKLDVGGSQKRFDGRPEDHYHVRCIRCGRVDDIMMPTVEVEQVAREASDYDIMGHSLLFSGICPACKKDD